MSEADFSGGVSGASESTPKQAKDFKIGDHVVITKGKEQKACKIIAISTSKTGKHGHAKKNFIAVDIFDNSKHETICQSTHNMEEPVIVNLTYQVVYVEDDYVEIMEDDGTRKFVKCSDEDVLNQIKEFYSRDDGCYVTYKSAFGNEQISNPKALKK